MKAYGKTTAMSDEISLLNVPTPAHGADELLVRVEAIGVGVHDEYFHALNVTYPYVIGIEAAGSVVSVGETVTHYQPGDRIAFTSTMQPQGGTWAEYAVISSQSMILPIPDTMSFERAAAIPVAGNTALKIIHAAEVTDRGAIFIAGGAGAIGSLLIQLAKQRGLTVIASASARNHAYLKELGADYTVDYHDHDWQDQVLASIPDGVDAGVGIHPGTPEELQPVVKDGGVVVAVSGDQFATERDIILKRVFGGVDVLPELKMLTQQIDSGEIIQTIEKVYPFSQALEALGKVKSRHNKGKLVISLSA